ncbi:hypothetical protein HMPREF3197_04041 [Klebsiella pneumoniae]|nr:hypothetical protein HMPREF3197_04041 [Klebsiella pneumoniae]
MAITLCKTRGICWFNRRCAAFYARGLRDDVSHTKFLQKNVR